MTFFASKTWFLFIMFMKQKVALSTRAQQISDEASHNGFVFLSTFNFNILVCLPFAAITAAYLSGIVPIYFLRTSTLMLSHASCNSSQRLSFEYTIDLSSLFPTRLKFARWGWGPDLEGASPSFSMFQKIASAAGSSGNSLFNGYCNGQFNKNNWNLLNMPSVLTISCIQVDFAIVF